MDIMIIDAYIIQKSVTRLFKAKRLTNLIFYLIVIKAPAIRRRTLVEVYCGNRLFHCQWSYLSGSKK